MKLKKLGLFRTHPNRFFVRKAENGGSSKEIFKGSATIQNPNVSYDDGKYRIDFQAAALADANDLLEYMTSHKNITGYIKVELQFVEGVLLEFENEFNFVSFSRGYLPTAIDLNYLVFGTNDEFGVLSWIIDNIESDDWILYRFTYNNDSSEYINGIKVEYKLEGEANE